MKNVVIKNPVRLEETKKAMAKEGADKLQVLPDFDGTLTKENMPLIKILRENEEFLSDDYRANAKALAAEHLPIEKDLSLPMQVRKDNGITWWSDHYLLLEKEKLNISDVKRAMKSWDIHLKSGVKELLDLLQEKQVPVVIMSSAGLGGDAIRMYLENQNLMFDNIYIIGNRLIWDENGYMTGVEKPIIHSLNKDETMVKDFLEVYGKVKDRKNVILLGNSDGDAEMITGFDYDSLIKIGFLNKMDEEKLKVFEEKYDVVIIGDDSAEYVVKLVNDILNSCLTF